MNPKNPIHRRSLSAMIQVTVAVVAVAAVPATAAPDLIISSMSVQGTARLGNCNTVAMTVNNIGNEFTDTATLDIAVITFPPATPNQNRATKPVIISPMQPGAQVTFTVTDVEFLASGTMTLQSLVDSTQEITEANESNNTSTTTVSVSDSCTAPPPPPAPTGNPPGCDVEATFVAPSGSSVPMNTTYTYQVQFVNKGKATCDPFKVKLMRYNTKSCGGYGSQVGGSRAWYSVPSLPRNQASTASFAEKKTPSKSTVCLSLGFSPNNYQDDNNSNHHIKKIVSYQ